MDFNNGQLGMTVATPDNPMVQLRRFQFWQTPKGFQAGSFHAAGVGDEQLLGNEFRAHQPGEVRARYRLMPYAGAFDEAQAHRFGMETAVSQPLLQQFAPPTVPPSFPPEGGMLGLSGNPAILTLHVKPAHDGEGVVVRLLNVGDGVETAVIRSSLLQIQAAYRCTLLEERLHEIPVENGAIDLTMGAREITAVYLKTTR